MVRDNRLEQFGGRIPNAAMVRHFEDVYGYLPSFEQLRLAQALQDEISASVSCEKHPLSLELRQDHDARKVVNRLVDKLGGQRLYLGGGKLGLAASCLLLLREQS